MKKRNKKKQKKKRKNNYLEPEAKAEETIKSRVSVEKIECDDCGKRMLPKNLRINHKKALQGSTNRSITS